MSNDSFAPAPQARVKVAHPYLVLMGLYLGGFTGMYSETALNIALPQLSAAFGVDLSLAQWLVVGYMLVIGIVLPFSSLLMKWFSAKKITVFALSSFLLGSLVSGFAPNFAVALAGRAIQGVGTGLVLPLMFSLVLEVIPPHKIGSAMGVNALVIMSASAVGPTIAGMLIGAFSWRAVFFSFAVILVVALVFALLFMVNPYELTKPKIDALSVVASICGFGGVVLGAGIASIFGWASAPTLAALAVGIVGIVVYVRRQLRLDVPVINMRVFSVRGFTLGGICVMINFGITLSAMYILPQYLQNVLLLDVAFAGVVMLPGGIVNTVVSSLAGRVYDRIGARTPALAGFALSVVGAALLLTTGPGTPLAFVIVCHIILMVGVPLAMSPCQTHALASLPPELSTDGSTMLNTMQQVLGAICTAIATFLLSMGQSAYYATGGTQSSLAFTEGAHLGFSFTLALAVVAFVVATRIAKPQRQTTQEAETAGGASAMQAKPQYGESQVGVVQLMKAPAYTVPETATALDALEFFVEKGISGAPVVDGAGNLSGFVSDGDIIGTLAKQDPSFSSYYAFAIETDGESFDDRLETLKQTSVGEIATKDVQAVHVGDDMRDVCALLAGKHLKKAPVLDASGKMVGVINRSNITKHAVARYAARA